jgi:hypothetical protein
LLTVRNEDNIEIYVEFKFFLLLRLQSHRAVDVFVVARSFAGFGLEQNLGELVEVPDLYVSWKGQGIYFDSSASMLFCCTRELPLSLTLESFGGKKLTNDLQER